LLFENCQAAWPEAVFTVRFFDLTGRFANGTYQKRERERYATILVVKEAVSAVSTTERWIKPTEKLSEQR